MGDSHFKLREDVKKTPFELQKPKEIIAAMRRDLRSDSLVHYYNK